MGLFVNIFFLLLCLCLGFANKYIRLIANMYVEGERDLLYMLSVYVNDVSKLLLCCDRHGDGVCWTTFLGP